VKRLLLECVAVATLVGACNAVPTFVPPTPDISSPVEGVVISVDSEGLGQVRGFTLRPMSNPFSFVFVLGPLENPTDFPLGHLVEHQASSQPVRAYFRVENGERVVYRLEDAASPPGAGH
jgi:hypothetical protein